MTSVSPGRRPLFVWRDVPLDVERPLWAWVVERWGAEVVFVTTEDFSAERASLDWGASGLTEIRPPDAAKAYAHVLSLYPQMPLSVNVFHGLRGHSGRAFRAHLRQPSRAGTVVIAERPTKHGTGMYGSTKNLVSSTLYRFYARRYSRQIDAFLAYGRKGVETYAELGFDRAHMFPFMYAPFTNTDAYSPPKSDETPTRFIYVGRLDAHHKGLDILLSAIQKDPSLKVSLTIVGGYGDMLSAVRAVESQDSRVEYLGPWAPSEVVRRLTEYDVCIIPSRYDGWNAVTNHAINAALATIASDQTTSHELIEVSRAGIIVPAGDESTLQVWMRNLAADTAAVNVFKQRARAYRSKISTETVGSYLLDVLDFASAGRQPRQRPEAPWL